jgi:hypothetical protein
LTRSIIETNRRIWANGIAYREPTVVLGAGPKAEADFNHDNRAALAATVQVKLASTDVKAAL